MKQYEKFAEVLVNYSCKLKKGEKVFKFQMPMEATNNLEVRAGEYSDSAVIYKTDKARPEYKLKKGDSSNWM